MEGSASVPTPFDPRGSRRTLGGGAVCEEADRRPACGGYRNTTDAKEPSFHFCDLLSPAAYTSNPWMLA